MQSCERRVVSFAVVVLQLKVKKEITYKNKRFCEKKKEAQKPPSQMLTPKHTIWEELPYEEQR